MSKPSKIIDETAPSDAIRRNIQNRIIGIIILYVAAFLLFITAGSQDGLFPYLLIGVVIINTFYLVFALLKLSRLT